MRHGSEGPKAHRHHRHGSDGPKGDNGLHLGQIKKMLTGAIAAANASAQGAANANTNAATSSPSGGAADAAAIAGLTSRLGDVMDRLGRLTALVGEATSVLGGAPSAPAPSAPAPATAPAPVVSTAPPPSGTAGTSGAGGSGGAGGTGGTGSTGSTSSTTNSLMTLMPFQGPTDFGSITINGVTTEFGIIDATGGLSARQVTGSLVNIINSNPDNQVTAQQRDNKILLVAKDQGATITVDSISFGNTSGTTGGFAGFLDGMSGSGTLFSNPISPIRQ
jgi:hypothetical protein